jgi:hypothetical protein
VSVHTRKAALHDSGSREQSPVGVVATGADVDCSGSGRLGTGPTRRCTSDETDCSFHHDGIGVSAAIADSLSRSGSTDSILSRSALEYALPRSMS